MIEPQGVSAASVQKKNYKRRVRNILIHRPMQREFTLILIALLMVSSLAIGFVIHDTIHQAAFGGGFRFGKINPYEVLSEVRYQLIMRVTCILFVTLIVIGVFAIMFLHRVAGPVHRFRQIFERMNDGLVPTPIKLREGDFFNEVATEVNSFSAKWRFEQIKMDRIKEKLDQIRSKSSDPNLTKVVDEAKQLINESPK